jgi:hypothetical protein
MEVEMRNRDLYGDLTKGNVVSDYMHRMQSKRNTRVIIELCLEPECFSFHALGNGSRRRRFTPPRVRFSESLDSVQVC